MNFAKNADNDDDDDDEIIECPYNRAHRIRLFKLEFHLEKCRENYLEPNRYEIRTCPFDGTHKVPSPELQVHKRFCNRRRNEFFANGSRNSTMKPIPNLFSVKENWDIDSSTTNERCENDSAFKTASKNDRDRFSPNPIKNGFLSTSQTKEPELAFIKILKIDNGGRFVPINDEDRKKSNDKQDQTTPNDEKIIFDKFSDFRKPSSTKKWPKTMRRDNFSDSDGEPFDSKKKSYQNNYSSSKSNNVDRTRSVDVDYYAERDSPDVLCDPKPSFAPLRRGDVRTSPMKNVQKQPSANGGRNRDETFRIFKPSDVFDEVENEEKFKFMKPSDVFDVKSSRNNFDDRRRNFKSNSSSVFESKSLVKWSTNGNDDDVERSVSNGKLIESRSFANDLKSNQNDFGPNLNVFGSNSNDFGPNSNGFGSNCNNSNKFYNRTDSPATTTRSGSFSVSIERSNSVASKSSDSTFENVQKRHSPNNFVPIMVERNSHSSPIDLQAKLYSESLSTAPIDDLTEPFFDSKSNSIGTAETTSQKKVPEVFNIYQQYEQYGLTDDFDFPTIGNSFTNLSTSDVALTKQMQNLSVQKQDSLLNTSTYQPQRDFFGRSLFSYGP